MKLYLEYSALAILLCKSSSAAGAVINADVPGEAHQIASTNSSQSNSWEPIPPFTQDTYTFDGSTDPSILIHDDTTAGYISALVSTELRSKPADEAIVGTAGVIGSGGLDGGVRIRIGWIVEDGLAFTYGQCTKAIDILVAWLKDQQQSNHHALCIVIHAGTHIKIMVRVELEKGEDVDFEPGSDTFMTGHFYPTRKLPPQDVRAVLYAAESEDDWHKSHPQSSLVPENTVQSYTRGQVLFEFQFRLAKGEVWPEFTYEDLSMIMEDMQRFFLKRGVYAAYYGTLTFRPDKTAEPKDVGYLKIEFDSSSTGIVSSNPSINNTTILDF